MRGWGIVLLVVGVVALLFGISALYAYTQTEPGTTSAYMVSWVPRLDPGLITIGVVRVVVGAGILFFTRDNY
jgi:hypothetical protein